MEVRFVVCKNNQLTETTEMNTRREARVGFLKITGQNTEGKIINVKMEQKATCFSFRIEGCDN